KDINLIIERFWFTFLIFSIVSSDIIFFRKRCADSLSNWKIIVVSSRISRQTSMSSSGIESGVNDGIPIDLQVSLIRDTLSTNLLHCYAMVKSFLLDSLRFP